MRAGAAERAGPDRCPACADLVVAFAVYVCLSTTIRIRDARSAVIIRYALIVKRREYVVV